MRILVIEDDPNLNNQIKQSLEDSGYSVDTALDGEEGHFLGDTEPYDAVVLDLGLPKVDGTFKNPAPDIWPPCQCVGLYSLANCLTTHEFNNWNNIVSAKNSFFVTYV